MALNGCMVKKAADQTAADYSSDTAITWDTDVYDVGGWHDTGSNTSRLTVPSGVSYVRLAANLGITSLATLANVFAWVTKDGDNNAATRHVNLPLVLEDSDSLSQYVSIVSGPVAVTAGAYFELRLLCSGDASVTLEDHSWFCIEELPSFSGCLVKKAADQTTADYSGTAVISWDTEAFDVGGWHSAGDPTKLTVPSGVNYVRLTASVQVTSITGGADCYVSIIKNGSSVAVAGLPVVLEDSDSTSQCLNLVSAAYPVIAGDFFECTLLATGDASVTIEDYSWFSIEKVA
jgi:hypothetical protein